MAWVLILGIKLILENLINKPIKKLGMEATIYYGLAEDQFTLDFFDDTVRNLGGRLITIEECVKTGIFCRRNLREIYNYKIGGADIQYLRYRSSPKHPWRTSIVAKGSVEDISLLERGLQE